MSACSAPSSSGHDEHASAIASAACGSRAAASHTADPEHENAAQPAGVAAVDLRAKLEQLLGQHAILTVRLTRARLRGDGDLAQTADAALSKNTEDMGELVGSAFGGEAAARFEKVWFDHVTYLFDYARGVADKDPEAQRAALAELNEYVDGISAFFAEATKGAAPADVVHHELQTHVNQLVNQTDAYALGNYDDAFRLERESYAHMFPLAKLLAAGIVAGAAMPVPEDFDSPAHQVQSRLGMALGEHAELAVDAMRSGFSGLPDFPAAGSALDANTRELTAVIESLFGPEAAAAFQSLWADHIDAFVSYTQALAAGDTALKDEANARLKQFNTAFSAFLSTSTQGRLAAPALADAFVMHEDFLLRQINAYAERDYSTAHQLSYDAYQHMFGLAALAAAAIGDTVAAQSPQGGMQTGLGGMAAAVAEP